MSVEPIVVSAGQESVKIQSGPMNVTVNLAIVYHRTTNNAKVCFLSLVYDLQSDFVATFAVNKRFTLLLYDSFRGKFCQFLLMCVIPVLGCGGLIKCAAPITTCSTSLKLGLKLKRS